MSMPEEPQSAPACQNRNEAFGEGGGPVASPGLQQEQARDNPGPARVRLSGSGNGMSSDMAASTMSGTLPTANGQSQSTYTNKKCSRISSSKSEQWHQDAP
jgi:hypothetical protein